jgi:hypothetical protein
MKKALLLLVLFAFTVVGADVAGTWKATAEGPMGTIERTFVFQVDGTTLTGETTSSFTGKSEIRNGKVEGDNLSFTITVRFQDNEMQMNYKGKVTGDDLKLTAEGGNGMSIEWSGKRVK